MSNLTVIRQGRVFRGLELSDSANVVQQFARSEIRRISRKCFGVSLSGGHGAVIRLDCGSEDEDRFSIAPTEYGLEIFGSNSRSLLFGVYAFLKRYFGCRWYAPGEEIPPQGKHICIRQDRVWRETASFPRRYVSVDNNEFPLSLARRMVDWAPRNMIGEISFTVPAWERCRAALEPEMEKRGLALALSGHSMTTFIPKSNFTTHPEWFAVINGSRCDKGQYCFSNPSFRRALAQRAAALIGRAPALRRISFWAEDTSLVCECPVCRKNGFLKSYIACINETARLLKRDNPRVEVDFLAYNAGLSWKMLEPAPALNCPHASLEIAYWGRDYRYGLSDSKLSADRRAERCMRQWRKQTAVSLSVLEYYTDIWMLTHLIPPLPRRIARDCKAYGRLGCDGLGTLHCIVPAGMNDHSRSIDRFEPLAYPNLYFFAVFAWNPRQSVRRALQDYARNRFGTDAGLCLGYMEFLEKLLPEIISFNQTLFRLRFVDLWFRDETPAQGGIKFLPVEWSPEKQWNNEERRRFVVCGRLVNAMNAFEKKRGWRVREKDAARRARVSAFRDAWHAGLLRLRAIYIQLKAQEAMCASDRNAAMAFLLEALSMRGGILKSEEKICGKRLKALGKQVQ